MSVRLRNESIQDKWGELGLEHFKDDKTIYMPVNDMWTGKENLLTVKYSQSYPFRPPVIIYNGQNILTFYGEMHGCSNLKIKDDVMKFLGGVECACCSSLVCSNNWTARNSIKNTLTEFNKFCQFKIRSIERYWSDRICSRLLVEDIPLRDYL